MSPAPTLFGWPWSSFLGSAEALKYARRDLAELDVLLRDVPGRTAVVQAGGNLGMYPRRLAELFETVYAFEPAPDLFAAMQRNAPAANIVRLQAAVGDERRLVGMSRARRDGKPNAHEGITHVSGEGVIPTLRIDDLGLPVCDLVMLDVEGWELFALRGAHETLMRCRPVVCVEINRGIEFVGLTGEDVRGYLHGCGYGKVRVIGSDEVFLPLERIDVAGL